MTIGMNERFWIYSRLSVGDYAVLVQRENLITGEKWYLLYPDEGGIAGNLNHEERCYHGWRGTTNNVRVEAMGRRMVTAVHFCKNGRVRVWITRDLNPDVEE